MYIVPVGAPPSAGDRCTVADDPGNGELSLRGRSIALSLERRFIADLMRFSRATPAVPLERRVNLARVKAAREAHPEKPAWSAIFVKAYALVARDIPELRRVYLRYPRPHLFEYPCSVANVAIERDFGAEKAVLPKIIKQPASIPLAHTSASIRDAIHAPIEEVSSFRRALRVTRFPYPLRWAIWHFGLNTARPRANYFGTFAVTAVPALGADLMHPLSPLTTVLTYGPIDVAGDITLRLIFDHRVLDAGVAARALKAMEEVLKHEILAELQDAVVCNSPVGFKP